jgi:hypothetical protein
VTGQATAEWLPLAREGVAQSCLAELFRVGEVVRVIRRGALVDRQVPGTRMVATAALRRPGGATSEDEVELLSLTVCDTLA